MRLGIAHHLGWAVAVTASVDHKVVDRRRIELIEPGLPAAPIHHEGGPHLLHRSGEPLEDDALAELVADVRASAVRAASVALDELATALPAPIVSMSLRAWPADFPDDIATLRRVPYESRADSVMYCQVLAELARARAWVVHVYNAKDVEGEAVRILGDLGERADEVLYGPRATLGPPWSRTTAWRSRQRSWSTDPPWALPKSTWSNQPQRGATGGWSNAVTYGLTSMTGVPSSRSTPRNAPWPHFGPTDPAPVATQVPVVLTATRGGAVAEFVSCDPDAGPYDTALRHLRRQMQLTDETYVVVGCPHGSPPGSQPRQVSRSDRVSPGAVWLTSASCG